MRRPLWADRSDQVTDCAQNGILGGAEVVTGNDAHDKLVGAGMEALVQASGALLLSATHDEGFDQAIWDRCAGPEENPSRRTCAGRRAGPRSA